MIDYLCVCIWCEQLIGESFAWLETFVFEFDLVMELVA